MPDARCLMRDDGCWTGPAPCPPAPCLLFPASCVPRLRVLAYHDADMRTRTLPRTLLPAVPCTLVAASSSLAQESIGTAPAAKATIQQVAFIAGQWTGTLGDRHIEQHRMTPVGTSMVAAYRNVQGTEPKLYELLVI